MKLRQCRARGPRNRYPTLDNLSRDILTGGLSPPTKDATPAAVRHGNWDLDCYRWDDLNRVRVAKFLNEALADPLMDAFPGIEVGN